jgi:hypothetical protein
VRTTPPVSMLSPIIHVSVTKAGKVGCKCIYLLSMSGNLKLLADKLMVVISGRGL